MDLLDEIRSSVRIVAPSIHTEYERIVINVEDGLNRLYADPRAFRQILINLLSNALKYSRDDTQIIISASQTADGDVHVSVADSGIGIPADDLELVLEPFGQSRQNSGLTHEGTGLGLALSKQLMELGGGTLDIESRLGVGTVVKLHFPNRALDAVADEPDSD